MNCPKCTKPNRDAAIYCKFCGESVITKKTTALQDLVGLTDVKNKLQDIIQTAEKINERAKHSGIRIPIEMDMVISGKSGTGKSKLVEVIQQLLYAAGLVKNPKPVIVDAVDWEDFSGTAKSDGKSSAWEENIKNAKGGLLVIDNAQKLIPQKESDEINKLDRLFADMEKWRGDPITILVGLPGLRAFMASNPEIAKRFEHHFFLKDYTEIELAEITDRTLQNKYKLGIEDDAKTKLINIFKNDIRHKNDKNSDFRNAHTAINRASSIFENVIRRDARANVAIQDDVKGTEFRQKTYEEVMAELNEFVGVDEIRSKVDEIIKKMDLEVLRKGDGAKREIKDHFLFLGNPGTGKTTIARVFADILNALEVLPTGQLVEVAAKDLIAGYIGQTALATEDAIDSAMGGVLFIDEAYDLNSNSFGKEAINTLLKMMEDRRGKFVCIAAGYSKEMADFIATNSGLSSRFNETVNFRDYKPEELTEIFTRMAKKEKLSLDPEAEKHILNFFRKIYISRDATKFGNAREARNVLDKAMKKQAVRVAKLQTTDNYNPADLNILTREDIEGEDVGKEKDLNQILAELDEFIGMTSVKEEIRQLANKLEMDRIMMERGLVKNPELTNVHIVLTGNPGTGKTTIAKKLGEIFKAINLLPTDKLVEKESKNLKSSFMNDTAKLVDKAVDEAMGGILFIDEAYSLAGIDQSGNIDKTGEEAVASLITRMSNDAGKFVLICAGYKREMDAFIDKGNPGFKRRFTHFLHIEDYTVKELMEIFLVNAKKQKLRPTDEAKETLEKLVQQMYIARPKNWGNAGEMTKLLDKIKIRKQNRLQKLRSEGVDVFTPEIVETIEAVDIPFEKNNEKDLNQILAELDEFIGMSSVKEEIRKLANKLEMDRIMLERGVRNAELTQVHIVLTGNPGTGKTTIAKKLGEIFKAINLLPTDKLIEKESKNLKSSFANETAKVVDVAVDEAMGGILFIDEAYSLAGFDQMGNIDKTGEEAVASLITRMSNDAGKFVLICAGYKREMDEFIDKGNPGFKRRFTHFLHIEDYSVKELMEIFLINAKKQKLQLTDEAKDTLQKLVQQLYDARPENWGNAGEMTKLLDQVKNRKQNRLQKLMSKGVDVFTQEIVETIEAEDIPFEKPKELKEEEIFAELNELVGLDSVKTAVREIAEYIKVERAKAEALGKKYQGISDHYLFVGNPGTGKTTVARIMANVFYTLGVLPTNKLVEVTRKDLVGQYIGTTAPKTARAIKSAVGGVFFIDEAYSLAGTGNDFGPEATEEILTSMLNYKGKMVFIAAGYPLEMQRWIDSNSGLESRFTKKLHFEDYKPDELSQIFLMKAAKDQLTLTPEAEAAMQQYFTNLYDNRGRNFANAREVNNYFDKAKKRQAARLLPRMSAPDFSPEEYKILTEDDFINL